MTSTRSSRYRRLLSRMQQARRDAGLSQERVAAALGRPQSYVSKCESGERRMDVLELADFAALYGTTVGALLGETDLRGAAVAAEQKGTYRSRRAR